MARRGRTDPYLEDLTVNGFLCEEAPDEVLSPLSSVTNPMTPSASVLITLTVFVITCSKPVTPGL